jgi:hypothetical protein
LSVPAFKEPRYVLAVVPFLYAFAGLSLAAFARSPEKLRPATASVVRFSMLVSIAAFFAVGLFYLLGGPVTGWYVATHAFGTLLCLALGEVWMRTRFVTRELAGLSVAGLIAFAIAYPHIASTPPFAALADLMRPRLASAAAGYPSFVARDCDVLQGYLDRTGIRIEDWMADPERAAADDRLRAFVVAPDEAEQPAARSMLIWLAANTREIAPADLAKIGAGSGYRLFVR